MIFLGKLLEAFMFDLPPDTCDIPVSHYESTINTPQKSDLLYTVNFSKNSSKSSQNSPKVAGLVNTDETEDLDVPYSEIAYNDEDLRKLNYIISKLGSEGYVDLLKDERTMRQYGRDIEHIHPLKFLALIFNNPGLKGQMNSLSQTWIKWHLFMKDLSARLDIEKEIGKVDEYLPDFCQDVGLPVSRVKPYTDNWDWEGLVKMLIHS
jgi:hypothetical protein